LEKRLEQAVVAALGEGVFASEAIVCNRNLTGAVLPHWAPQPGRIDVAVVTPQLAPRITFELKIDKVGWTLWDIYKMVDATYLPTVEAAYCVVAAAPKVWASKADCVELYQLQSEGPSTTEWYSRFLFDEYRASWLELLYGGGGRPTRVPERIAVTVLGAWPMPNYPPHELRAIRVGPVEDSGWVDFGAWPLPALARPQPPWPDPIANDRLQRAHVPGVDAPEDAYHRFALTFDGYREQGSDARCARIANNAIETWRLTGELPHTLRDLRACLFFEQRRWHHFGRGFNDETMRYVREITSRIKELLPTGSTASAE
jgi:hypothetical protein